MTTFYLIRHASNDWFTHTLVGRMPGVHLNELGRAEAEKLADGIASERIQQLFCSPLERCRETAEPIARRLNLPIQVEDALVEVEFGEWTGKRFTELDPIEDWKRWNAFRSGVRVPGGETMLEVQARMVKFVQSLCGRYPDQRIALVSHGDPIRAVLLYFLSVPLDHVRRIEIDPASVSVLSVDRWMPLVRSVNARFGVGGLVP